MTITADQMRDAQRAGHDVIIIINGLYFDFEPETETDAETTPEK